MSSAILYPLDYQLTLATIIDTRLNAARAAGRSAQTDALRAALARLRAGDIGACASCGKVIPYLQLVVDPAIQQCLSCVASRESGAIVAR